MGRQAELPDGRIIEQKDGVLFKPWGYVWTPFEYYLPDHMLYESDKMGDSAVMCSCGSPGIWQGTMPDPNNPFKALRGMWRCQWYVRSLHEDGIGKHANKARISRWI